MNKLKRFFKKKWVIAGILTIPVFAYFIGYWFNHAKNLIPTGFIQYDNVGYIAYAKQYLDAEKLSLTFSNPFAIDSPAIYFQPQTLLFAALLKFHFPLSLILPLFTIISTFITYRIVIAIYELIVTNQHRRTSHLLLLGWGGGIFVLAGIGYNLVKHGIHQPWDSIFILDPENGWWGLNLGRSLLFSCEAYYHALFLGCIYYTIKRNWKAALIVLFVLSLSHPFTGIELILIIALWSSIECFYLKQDVPKWFVAFVFFIALFHLWYYLVYLNGFADHKSVSDQYALNWRLRYYRMLPAYCLAGGLAFGSLYLFKNKLLNQTHNRLFLFWFLAAFLLANHEWFIKARQPIHFTRGYIWTSLLLLGLPALVRWTSSLTGVKKKTAYIAFAALMLLDNMLWYGMHAFYKSTEISTAYISAEEQALFDSLNKHSNDKSVIIAKDNKLACLSTVYTKAYPLFGHIFTTPFAKQKLEMQNDILLGKFNPRLPQKEFFIIQNKSLEQEIIDSSKWTPLYQTQHYTIWKQR